MLRVVGQIAGDSVVAPDRFGEELHGFGQTGVGFSATEPDEVEPVIRKALTTKKPVIMDFVVEQEECVYPMVPAGAPISTMMLL